MNRVIEYFENLDKKNFLMLILSIVIIGFIVIFYVNDFFEVKEKEIQNKKIKLIKKIKETSILNNKIAKIKKENLILKTKLKNLRSDYNFLISTIESSNVLIVDKKEFLSILHKYLKVGSIINASFDIFESDKLDKFKLKIKGDFNLKKFFDFVYFLKSIESPKKIITINNLTIEKNNRFINYDLNVTLWSFR